MTAHCAAPRIQGVGNYPLNWIYRTSITHQSVARPDMTSRFIKDTILDGELISGSQMTRNDLTQLARASANLHIDIQDLTRAEGGYAIICDASRLHDESESVQMKADAESLPTFIDFFLDDNVVGVAVQAIGPEATAFKLRWG